MDYNCGHIGDKAIELDEDNAHAYNARAIALREFGQLGLADGGLCGLAIDYGQLVGGGTAFNGEIKQRRKIWKVKGT